MLRVDFLLLLLLDFEPNSFVTAVLKRLHPPGFLPSLAGEEGAERGEGAREFPPLLSPL